MAETKRTLKDFYHPFYDTIRSFDAKHRTSLVPKGLNKNSRKADFVNFHRFMETKFSLMDATVEAAKKKNSESEFIKNLRQVRNADLADIPKKSPQIQKFKTVLSAMLTRHESTPKHQYVIRMKHDYEFEYKTKDGEASDKVYSNSEFETKTIEAKNETELKLIFEWKYGTEAMSGEASDSYTHCVGATYEILDVSKLNSTARPELKQLMKAGSFILSKEWLKFTKYIADTAFEETNDMCCYHQLSQFINNPPSGRPNKKFIDKGQKTDSAGIFALFQEFANTHTGYSDFNMTSGVSSEMVVHLCKTLGRSCYGYNSDDKCFVKHIDGNKSKNYCPIAFYKVNGHMFILNDKECFKMIAESNKPTVKIVTSLVDNNVAENEDFKLNTQYIQSFDVQNAKQMASKMFIINKSDIFDEFLNYILHYKTQPNAKTKEGRVVYMCFKNDQNERVVISCDSNYGKVTMDDIGYEQIQQECERIGIQYTNQGVGTIVNDLFGKYNDPEKRRYLSDEDKQIVNERCHNLCAECHLQSTSYEYDHIIPLAGGGSNRLENFQILCEHCHLEKTTKEQQDGSYKPVSKIHSSFNNLVLNKVIDTNHFKSHQFIEQVNSATEDIPIFKIDMKRCRKNVLYYSKYQFPVYSVMDYPNNFSGKIQCGYYYVDTFCTFPLRGCGWYCEAMVVYCLQHEIISMNEILFEFIPSTKLQPNHFQGPIDFIVNSFEHPKLQKLAINALIGCWGIQKKFSTYSKFSLAEDEASQWFVDNNVFIKTHRLGDLTLFEGCYENRIAVDDNAYPLYSMVLQLEAIELHRLESLVIRKNGTPLDRNTDAIRYQRAEGEINIEKYYWDGENKQVPKYQNESNQPLRHQSLPSLLRSHYLRGIDEFKVDWKFHNNLSPTQIFELKEGMLINGRAGTGKTFLVKQLIELIKAADCKVECLAPTNKAARLIGGKTLDSVNYQCIVDQKKLVKWAQELHYLIVDEISMVHEKFYRLLTNIKKINPKIIFFICGDFEQLKPVNDDWNGDYENSPVLKDICNNNKLVLTECKRSDDTLFNLCQNVQSIDITRFRPTHQTYLNIAFTHKTRIEVNNMYMELFLNDCHEEPIAIPKDDKNPKTQDLKLVKGMPIICHKTNKKLNILNSERFEITKIDNETITFTNDFKNEPIEVDVKDFHNFFYLAYCITIHASQGDTFTSQYTIYDWERMSKRAKYVAMSRGNNIDNIQIHQ